MPFRVNMYKPPIIPDGLHWDGWAATPPLPNPTLLPLMQAPT